MTAREACPTCKRPFKQLASHERARAGDHPGVEREAARAFPSNGSACQAILDALVELPEYPGSWVSARQLRDVLGGGDGPRRARQLRDEYGWPVEVEFRSGPPRQAWYRLDPSAVDRPTLF